MGLSIALNNALTGLQVNQQQLSVLSQNIANANTAGYSRQTANQKAMYLDGQSEGVSIQDITRQVDQYLSQAVQGQSSVVGAANVISDYNARVQLLMGQPGSNNSIDTFVGAFFNNLQALAETPGDATLQQAAVNSGIALASQMQSLVGGLQGLQYQADQDITSSLNSVNTDLQTLANINTAISNNAALGHSIAGLQDQRDSVLKDISQYMNVQSHIKSDGSVSLTSGSGVTLLDGPTAYHLSYNSVSSAASFAGQAPVGPITVTRTDSKGMAVGQPQVLVTGGVGDQVGGGISSGKIAGLLVMRDQQLPQLLGQLDTMAYNLQDQFNQIQNSGSGYPGANSYTGTRPVNAGDYSNWSGGIRLAVLDQQGQPIPSPYNDEPNGVAPLTLNLSDLNTGEGDGNPSVQGIIDAINQAYGPPQNKAELANLNNIQLISDSKSLPGVPPQFSFDLSLNNNSTTDSTVYVTGVHVVDNTGATVSDTPAPVASVALAATGTFVTSPGSLDVTVHTAQTNHLTNGQTIYLAPGQDIDGIPEVNMTGFFTISNVTGNSFQITATAPAIAGGNTDLPGQSAIGAYSTVPAGQTARTNTDGIINASLAGNTTSPYYDISVNVTADDGTGVLKTSTITYRVNNNQPGMLNLSLSALSASGAGKIVSPTSTGRIATASLVDANGIELPKTNGKYTTAVSGYLQIKANNSTYVVALDSMDSAQNGQPANTPAVPGTGRGFSYYFELNNFFQSNKPTQTGDTVAGSAANLQVESRFKSNAGLLSLGNLTPSPKLGSNTTATYERNISDNSVIQKLAALANQSINFAAAGGLGASSQTLGAYAGAVIGTAGTNASNATTSQTNAQTLLDGYVQQLSGVSGVNLDTELANTVIYQNAYSASARVITVANSLFDTLLQTFQ